jgi:hypothetical protein
MLVIRNAQMAAFQAVMNRETLLPVILRRLVALGFVGELDHEEAVGDPDLPALRRAQAEPHRAPPVERLDARVLRAIHRAEAHGFLTEDAILQWVAYDFQFTAGWDARPEVKAALARTDVDGEARLALVHHALASF